MYTVDCPYGINRIFLIGELMSASYQVILNNSNLKDYHKTVCYAPWYFSLDEVDTMVVRVPQGECAWITGTFDRDFNKYDHSAQTSYVDILKLMLQMPEVESEFCDYRDNKILKITFKNFSKVPEIKILTFINALRYLHEENMNEVIDNFMYSISLQKDNDFSSSDLWNMFADAHTKAQKNGVMHNVGHNLYQHFREMTHLSPSQYRDTILENYEPVNHGKAQRLPPFTSEVIAR